MEIEIKKSVLSLAFVALLMVVPPPPAWPTCAATASSLLKTTSNATTIRCNGLVDECLVMHDHYIDLEFMMGSEITRILTTSSDQETEDFDNKSKAVCDRSPPGVSYEQYSFPKSTSRIPPPVCRGQKSIYNRVCPKK
ncbi:hypothetical protein I3843_04G047600 [Carya illinoinensis]|nr:hypothetical protein I3843_04G047600 [Carya illinoinensis]